MAGNMKLILCAILVILVSCQSNEQKGYEIHFDENGPKLVGKANQNLKCPLTDLPNTIAYREYLEAFKSIKKDSLVELESKEIGRNRYQSIIDHRENEIHVWLIRKNMYNEKVDSILIEYSDNVEYLSSVNSSFDTINCLIVQEHKYWTLEEPECREVEIINFNSY